MDPDCAPPRSSRPQRSAAAWNQTHEDPDLAADLALIDQYLSEPPRVRARRKGRELATLRRGRRIRTARQTAARRRDGTMGWLRQRRRGRRAAAAGSRSSPPCSRVLYPAACSTRPCSPRGVMRTCKRSGPTRSRSCARSPSGCATATRFIRSASTPTSYYLTGFVEPDATLILRPGAETERVVMFVRPRDPEMEVWDGRRAGLDGAKAALRRRRRVPRRRAAGQAVVELIANPRSCTTASASTTRWTCSSRTTIARLRKTEKKRQAPAARGGRSARRAPRAAPAQAARGARGDAQGRAIISARRTSPRCAPAGPACSSTSSRR